MSALRFFLAKHPLALGVFVVALVASLYLVFDGAKGTRDVRGPAEANQPLEPWMTPRYVGRSWGLSQGEIEDLFELERSEGRPPTIGRIARDLGIPLEELEARVRAAAEAEGDDGRDDNDDDDRKDEDDQQ